ncbi:MAG: 50S ribosomal protein L6 [Parcubacteria group bacterium GW2011_GWC1_43_11b]|uniref:Large ribosomal subunit protein uL6 n=2 Tax=Candidatus Vogeliibacteriota TaxID=1817922 RepID=A0A1G2QBS9_9BACT|nr:MAG: 50S ribosomal protein L6 [Parcubacteria group bacterium GW2011_GWB1_42_9]KKS89091.1 MAG: 50S ribosomal protein L6 [Parcubacteria group bacterium GW2011_GWC1_43_11b]KKT09741.1 MAG: 50S ribosomal protein L6 [Parcubacteria group bacterium GW2011_GWA1_43_21]OHA57957.1 MAG: 50S ribosomal protein L6 [Candidatus Vogelbacteria bacterium RIFOXYB1_FULL_42_16]OHA59065.1 MAG: 50S ribosomal protein L6 [Candidatus Vogelbacteria bacterium RIFOXYD1_FULL_42_15]
MSRIGKKTIVIPEKVEVSLTDGLLTVKGPLGELSRQFKQQIVIKIDAENKTINLVPEKETVDNRALWGTYGSHITNMIDGVTKGFEKSLIIEGVGYRYAVAGSKVVLNIGFSHPVEVEIPAGLKVETTKGDMKIVGIDKEVVGSFSAKIRSLKPVEPYKGKGIRYVGEHVRRKQGKKTAA